MFALFYLFFITSYCWGIFYNQDFAFLLFGIYILCASISAFFSFIEESIGEPTCPSRAKLESIAVKVV